MSGNNGSNKSIDCVKSFRPFRSILFRHYFPYLYKPIGNNHTNLDAIRYDKFTTSSIEVQLQAEGVQYPNYLAYLVPKYLC
jgi:hypothetical protein